MIIEAQDSKMIRLLAFFPLFISGGFFAFAYSHAGSLSKLLGLAFLVIGLWTCLAQRRRYIDTKVGIYAIRSNWLWMRWNNDQPLAHFTHIGIVLDSIPGDGRTSDTYDIYLFRGSNADQQFEIFKTRDQALKRAAYIAQHTGLPLKED